MYTRLLSKLHFIFFLDLEVSLKKITESLSLNSCIFGLEYGKVNQIWSIEAYHRAMWMYKITHSMKIYIFRGQFKIRAAELYGIQQFNVFIVRAYSTVE